MKLNRIAPVTLCATFLLTASARAQSTTPSVETILQHYYDAIGGLNKLASIQSVKRTGTLNGEGNLLLYQERPNKVRSEWGTPGDRLVMGYDGARFWEIVESGGASQVIDPTAEMSDEIADESYVDGILVDHQKKGYTVELVGLEQVDGADAYKLKVSNAQGREAFYYLDAQSYLLMREEQTVPSGGSTVTMSNVLGDYRPEGGVLMPHDIKQYVGVRLEGEIRFAKIEVNPELDDSIFEQPTK